ncbi:MAG: hypothetical protein K6C30_00425 [Bacteroidaceae bacterium]|nr:hypothetical protein [Bacteroidaceae bacterium]
MSKKITTTTPPATYNKEQGWNRNTEFCMDVKTFLRSDAVTKVGKNYNGVLTRDEEDHFVFVETMANPSPAEKHNPRVFFGQYVTFTRNADGSYRPNFRPVRIENDFSVDAFALAVCDEIRQALTGLVDRED